jgi:hypothetical protein
MLVPMLNESELYCALWFIVPSGGNVIENGPNFIICNVGFPPNRMSGTVHRVRSTLPD